MESMEVLKKLNLISWPVLFVGFQNDWITKSDIADYAIDLLSLGSSDGDIAILAGAISLEDSEVKSLVLKLCGGAMPSEVVERWMLAKLTALSESDFSEGERLEKLQDLYAEFDYPEDMASCSVYSQDATDPLVAMLEVISVLKKRYAE